MYQVGGSCWRGHAYQQQYVLPCLQGHPTLLGDGEMMSETGVLFPPSPPLPSLWPDLALAQPEQGGDEIALPRPIVWPLRLSRQVAAQGWDTTVLPIQSGIPAGSVTAGTVLVPGASYVFRQSCRFSGCLLAYNFFTL